MDIHKLSLAERKDREFIDSAKNQTNSGESIFPATFIQLGICGQGSIQAISGRKESSPFTQVLGSSNVPCGVPSLLDDDPIADLKEQFLDPGLDGWAWTDFSSFETWDRQPGAALFSSPMPGPTTAMTQRPCEDLRDFVYGNEDEAWQLAEVPADELGPGGGALYSLQTLEAPTSQLEKYTSGKMGGTVRAPSPLPNQQSSNGNGESGTKAFRSEGEIAASLAALEPQGRDLLLTAPPNVAFKRGLTEVDLVSATDGTKTVEDQMISEKIPTIEEAMAFTEYNASEQSKHVSQPKATFNFTDIFGLEDDDDELFLATLDEDSDATSDSEETSEDDDESEEKEEVEDTTVHLESLTLSEKDPVPMQENEQYEDDLELNEKSIDLLLETGNTLPLVQKRNRKGRASEKKQSFANTRYLAEAEMPSQSQLLQQYPFKLDEFQMQAIARLERRESVFVAAHTSAGKTVVAEYAIAMAAAHMTRAIYTSPIKALSNQKYRDFKTRFNDVGLITGDVSINPQASCLIMTTEILRSMLYRGADLVRDIEWVIFDEVHYVNDTERGVVWEEVIIMLPDYVNLIFLSATTPNTIEFSDWIGRTKRRTVHVISTTHRPVPLQHFLYAGSKLHKVLDHNGMFLTSGHAAAEAAAAGKSAPEKKVQGRGGQGQTGRGGRGSQRGRGAQRGGRQGGRQGRGGPGRGGHQHFNSGKKTEWQGLINMLKKDKLLPVVCFSFSKKKCEENAHNLRSVDLSDGKEKAETHIFIANAVKRLLPADAKLPQILHMTEMLKRGIGVHHGGMLPLLKEIVEILFSRGLVKVLFATETFAMGVNMPARTVIFNGTRKHDGKDFRDLLPGEYTQMAGRAGRRGLDKVGTVIHTCWGGPPGVLGLKNMLTGTATKLSSQFRLTYNMILNLLRVEDMCVEDMIKRSFSEFATQRALIREDLPGNLKRYEKALKKVEELSRKEPCIKPGDSAIEDYYKMTHESIEGTAELCDMLEKLSAGRKSALTPGRIIKVVFGGLVDAPAMVLSAINQSPTEGDTNVLALVLCPIGFIPPKIESPQEAEASARTPAQENDDFFKGFSRNRLNKDDDEDDFFGRKSSKKKAAKELKVGTHGEACGRTYWLVNVGPSSVVMASSIIKKVEPPAILQRSENTAILKVVQALMEHEELPLPPLDFVKEMKLSSIEFNAKAKELKFLMEVRDQSKCVACPKLQEQYIATNRHKRLGARILDIKLRLSNESLSLFPDFQQRMAVLRSLGYVDYNNTVQMKGRVACELNTADELISTELIFENLLARLDPPEIAGVLSSLIFQEKKEDEPSLTPKLKEACDRLRGIAHGLAKLQIQNGLNLDYDEFMKGLNFGIVDVVYDWSRGVPFAEICQLTTVQEGSIVRAINRLNELVREMRNAARVIGDPTLYRKLESVSESIKRDIVFAASLYVS